MLRTLTFTFGIVLLAVASLGAHASAEVEYCPALVAVDPVGIAMPAPGATAQPTTDFAVRLNAASARSVSGVVAVHTTSGWYQAAIPFTPLRRRSQVARSSSEQFNWQEYQSAPLFVRFPRPVSVASAFMLTATAKDDTVFHWGARGPTRCNPRPDVLDVPSKSSAPASRARGAVARPSRDVEASPPNGTPFVVMQPLTMPQPICKDPFAWARALNVASPQYPAMLLGMGIPASSSLIAVAISSMGHVDDAWVYTSSGEIAFDDAAIAAARASTYRPARAFCQNVPGIYIFHANFSQP